MNPRNDNSIGYMPKKFKSLGLSEVFLIDFRGFLKFLIWAELYSVCPVKTIKPPKLAFEAREDLG